jgi:hypothetical protein
MGQGDFVAIPAGSATNNQNTVSWEIGFHYAGLTSQRFQKIWDKAYGAYMIEIDTYLGANEGLLTLYRATTSGSGARWYIPTTTVLRAGHNYYVQISWDASAGPGRESYPSIWIGEDGNAPVKQTHWDESGGALDGSGSWYNDASGCANLGNTANGAKSSANTAWLNGGFYVYRQYDSIVDFSNGGSWSTDKLAWTSTTVQPTTTPVPTVTPNPTTTPVPIVTPTTTPTVKPAAKPAATVKQTVQAPVTPTVKPAATPTVKATVKQTVQAPATPTVKPAAVYTLAQASSITKASNSNAGTSAAVDASTPGISVPSAQTSGAASLPARPVVEFSVLGLGLPELLAGLIYLYIRR